MKLRNKQGLNFADFNRLVLDKNISGDFTVKTVDRWINSFGLRVRALTIEGKDVSGAEVALFWIKLHGVLVELPDHLEPYVETLKAFSPKEDGNLRNRKAKASAPMILIRYALGVRKYALNLAKELTRDEHIYAEWRRHTEAHLLQHGYRLSPRKSGRGLKDSLTVKSLGEQVSIEEQRNAILRVANAYKNDDRALAVALARRLEPIVKMLCLKQQQYMALGGPPKAR